MKKQQTSKQQHQQPTPATQPMTDEQLGQIGGGQSISPNPTMGPWSVAPLPNGQPWSACYGTLGGAPFHSANIEIKDLKG
jgi:hypothetical protein